MKKGLLACALFALPVVSLSLTASSCVEAQSTIMEEYGAEAARIIEAVRSQGRQFEKLVELCDGIGPRLVGSPAGRLARSASSASHMHNSCAPSGISSHNRLSG